MTISKDIYKRCGQWELITAAITEIRSAFRSCEWTWRQNQCPVTVMVWRKGQPQPGSEREGESECSRQCCPLCGAVWRWSGGEVGRGGLLHLLSRQVNAGRHWRGTLACLLSNNYSLSIIEPLQFADLILTPKLAKYTNKTFWPVKAVQCSGNVKPTIICSLRT